MADRIPLTTTSYVIPIGDLSLDSRGNVRDTVDAGLVQFALDRKITTEASALVVRDVLPFTDLGLAGQTNSEDWLIVGAATAGTLLNYLAAKQLTTTQAIAFYGVGSPMASPGVSGLKFLFGNSGAQVKAYYHLQQLFMRLEYAGYFGSPLYYGPQEYVQIQVMPITSFAQNTEYLTLFAREVEQFGFTISAKNAI